MNLFRLAIVAFGVAIQTIPVYGQESLRPSQSPQTIDVARATKLPTLDLENNTRPSAQFEKYQDTLSRLRVPLTKPFLDKNTGEEYIPSPVLGHAVAQSLPVGISEDILVGEITGATALSSADQSYLLSVYEVHVESSLKGIYEKGQTLEFDRGGGVLRFPSGNYAIIGRRGAGILERGSKYLIFLQKTVQDGRLHLVTAYQIRSGLIEPVDSSGNDQAGSWNIQKGKTVGEVIQQVKDRLPEQGGRP